MSADKTGRKQFARLAGLQKYIQYPVARFDIEYQLVDENGHISPEVHTLNLALSDDEARQMAKILSDIAMEIQRGGGAAN